MTRTALALVALLPTIASADTAKKAPSADDMKNMMAMMEKMAAPGPEHKSLTDTVGTWTAVSKMYMDPTKPPMESQGTEEVTALLGGRFIQMHLTSTMMGKPFEGYGIEGYDNASKKWQMTWMDNWGTMIIHAEGTGDAKSRTFTGEETEPDGKKRPFRWVIKVVDAKKHTMEMYGPGMDGKEMKMMEVTYTKK
jgi:hypothetical protein